MEKYLHIYSILHHTSLTTLFVTGVIISESTVAPTHPYNITDDRQNSTIDWTTSSSITALKKIQSTTKVMTITKRTAIRFANHSSAASTANTAYWNFTTTIQDPESQQANNTTKFAEVVSGPTSISKTLTLLPDNTSKHQNNKTQHIFWHPTSATPSRDSHLEGEASLQPGIIAAVSAVLLVVATSLTVFLYCKHKRQRQEIAKTQQHPGIELHRKLPQVPDVESTTTPIYDQIENDEHYYSQIADSGTGKEATQNGQVMAAGFQNRAHQHSHPIVTTSPGPKPKFDGYVINCTCVEHDI